MVSSQAGRCHCRKLLPMQEITDASSVQPDSPRQEEARRPRGERQSRFVTVSLEEINRLYSPTDTAVIDFETDVAAPGVFPYTRGIHANGYRGKVWTMRQFAGFGTPEETNSRFKYLLKEGQTGLSVAYDLPALMGYDADPPLPEVESVKLAVALPHLPAL